jgi:predicted amidophosphoribosyltransferase
MVVVPAALSLADAADPVEAAIRRARENQRSCGVCGPRPEPDATYCSSCGRYLPGACAKCGTHVDLVGSRFCAGCGDQLAAA